jgi:hypothetical protein
VNSPATNLTRGLAVLYKRYSRGSSSTQPLIGVLFAPETRKSRPHLACLAYGRVAQIL